MRVTPLSELTVTPSLLVLTRPPWRLPRPWPAERFLAELALSLSLRWWTTTTLCPPGNYYIKYLLFSPPTEGGDLSFIEPRTRFFFFFLGNTKLIYYLFIRYNLDFEPKNLFPGKDEALDAAKKTKLKNQIKEQFQQKFNAGTNKWFFTKLRF